MPSWQPERYLRFEAERTRPCRDLIAQIELPKPATIIDLGCGPGNSTAALAQRWPEARITGLDQSPEMLAKARASTTNAEWVQGNIEEWARDSSLPSYDVVFSNAALQWVDDQPTVVARLAARVRSGGVLAFQIPADINAPAHEAMREIAVRSKWASLLDSRSIREWHAEAPSVYYDALAAVSREIDLWITDYVHVLPDVESIADWYRGTGLRPFLDALPDEASRDSFVSEYVEALRGYFPMRADRRVLFPFRRLFLIARI
jgi:trans-aconitate 2-methyltransferase